MARATWAVPQLDERALEFDTAKLAEELCLSARTTPSSCKHSAHSVAVRGHVYEEMCGLVSQRLIGKTSDVALRSISHFSLECMVEEANTLAEIGELPLEAADIEVVGDGAQTPNRKRRKLPIKMGAQELVVGFLRNIELLEKGGEDTLSDEMRKDARLLARTTHKLLEDSESWHRLMATGTLVDADYTRFMELHSFDAAKLLLDRLEDSFPPTRRFAVEGLRVMGSQVASDASALRKVALEDPDRRLRVEAARALGYLGPRAARESIAVLNTSDLWAVRAAAAISVGMGAKGPSLIHCRSALAATLRDDRVDGVREAAAYAMGQLGHTASRTSKLDPSTEGVRLARTESAKMLEAQDDPMRILNSAIRDPDIRVRITAVIALSHVIEGITSRMSKKARSAKGPKAEDEVKRACCSLIKALGDRQPAVDLGQEKAEMPNLKHSASAELEVRKNEIHKLMEAVEEAFAYIGPGAVQQVLKSAVLEQVNDFKRRMTILRALHCTRQFGDDVACAMLSEWIDAMVLSKSCYINHCGVANSVPLRHVSLCEFKHVDNCCRWAVLRSIARGELHLVFSMVHEEAFAHLHPDNACETLAVMVEHDEEYHSVEVHQGLWDELGKVWDDILMALRSAVAHWNEEELARSLGPSLCTTPRSYALTHTPKTSVIGSPRSRVGTPTPRSRARTPHSRKMTDHTPRGSCTPKSDRTKSDARSEDDICSPIWRPPCGSPIRNLVQGGLREPEHVQARRSSAPWGSCVEPQARQREARRSSAPEATTSNRSSRRQGMSPSPRRGDPEGLKLFISGAGFGGALANLAAIRLHSDQQMHLLGQDPEVVVKTYGAPNVSTSGADSVVRRLVGPASRAMAFQNDPVPNFLGQGAVAVRRFYRSHRLCPRRRDRGHGLLHGGFSDLILGYKPLLDVETLDASQLQHIDHRSLYSDALSSSKQYTNATLLANTTVQVFAKERPSTFSMPSFLAAWGSSSKSTVSLVASRSTLGWAHRFAGSVVGRMSSVSHAAPHTTQDMVT